MHGKLVERGGFYAGKDSITRRNALRVVCQRGLLWIYGNPGTSRTVQSLFDDMMQLLKIKIRPNKKQ